jgi:hypothetical protein
MNENSVENGGTFGGRNLVLCSGKGYRIRYVNHYIHTNVAATATPGQDEHGHGTSKDTLRFFQPNHSTQLTPFLETLLICRWLCYLASGKGILLLPSQAHRGYTARQFLHRHRSLKFMETCLKKMLLFVVRSD